MNRDLLCRSTVQILCLLLSITGFVNSRTMGSVAIQDANLPDLGTKAYANLTSQATEPSNTWRGLVPLRSTRVDVEKLLGKQLASPGSTVIYETEKERVNVLYSAGKCVLSGSERWNVPSDVVISIEVRPKKVIFIQDLHLDSKKYPRYQESHPENWFLYRNTEDGVMIETVLFKNEEHIDSISYFPTTKDKVLRCSSTKRTTQPYK